MLTYAIKRIALMIPTFFAISMLVFVLLNFGAGNPGAQQLSGEGNQNAEKGDNRESYRIFKEQFNLDKPIMFNTRYKLNGADVEATILEILNVDKNVTLADQIAARDRIENWGKYAVPGLIHCLEKSDKVEVRAKASARLTVNTQERLITKYTENRAAENARNKKTVAENRAIKPWFFTTDGKSAKTEKQVRGFWLKWWQDNEENWAYSTGDKMSILFTDTRFAKYWGNLLRLDFGKSHIDKKPVLETVLSKLKYSITLALSSVFLIYLISLPLGIWSAVRQNTIADKIVTFILFMLYSLPSFFVAVILLNALTVGDWAIFPNIGFQSSNAHEFTTLEYIKDIVWHVTLPIVCMSYGGLAALSRYARSGLLDVIRADYIRTARAKGLPEGIVIIKHAARNGMIPILTLMATLLPALIGGSVIIEVIFQIPGMGSYIFTSITQYDYNAVMAVLLISSVLTLIGMLLADLSYALVDPRITFD
jgi:peptide/nickel transport system permease protein